MRGFGAVLRRMWGCTALLDDVAKRISRESNLWPHMQEREVVHSLTIIFWEQWGHLIQMLCLSLNSSSTDAIPLTYDLVLTRTLLCLLLLFSYSLSRGENQNSSKESKNPINTLEYESCDRTKEPHRLKCNEWPEENVEWFPIRQYFQTTDQATLKSIFYRVLFSYII